MPSEMTGAQRPSWLDARIDRLQVAIYKRIKKFAIPAPKQTEVNIEDTLPKTDPHSFKDVPAGAGKALAAIKDAIGKRDYAALRPELDDNVVWSLGGGTGADVALATWQADTTILDAMVGAIDAGCEPAAKPKQVACPAGAPKPGTYQLLIEDKGGTWRITSFVRAE
jgi:hypothetical protein